MTRKIILIAALTLPLPLSLRAEPAPESVAAVLERQTQEMQDAVTFGRSEVWERYLHEDAVYTAEDGSVSTKAELVPQIRPLPKGVSGNLKVTDFKAHVHGTVAVATYVSDEHETYHGHELHCQYRVTDTWLKTEAGWRVVASQLLALRTDPPAVELTAHQMGELAGRYSLSPDVAYEIRRTASGLEGQQSGRPAETMLAEAPDVLFVPGKPRYRWLVQRGSDGRVTGLVERREAWDLDWTRLPEAPK